MQKKLIILVSAIILALAMYFFLKIYFFDDSDSIGESTNADQKTTLEENKVDTTKPYYLDDYYSIVNSDLFKIFGSREEIFENLKYFDFEYFTKIDFGSRYLRVFYVLYSEDGEYHLKRYHFSDENDISIGLPSATQYWLITDTIPTMRATIIANNEMESVELSYFHSYSKGLREQITAGGTPNPEKIMISFNLVGDESDLDYNDGEEVVVRTTRIHLTKSKVD